MWVESYLTWNTMSSLVQWNHHNYVNIIIIFNRDNVNGVIIYRYKDGGQDDELHINAYYTGM